MSIPSITMTISLLIMQQDGELISTLTCTLIHPFPNRPFLTPPPVTPSSSHLIICSRSLSMRIYSLKPSPVSAFLINFELLRTLKPHTTPVVVLAVDQTSTLLATGAADGVVKVWDILGGYVTHTFRGPNVLISALHFFELIASSRDEETGISSRNRKKDRIKNSSAEEDPQNETARGFRLASGSQDGKVRIWDLYKRTCVSILDSHVSDVRALDYSAEENALLTGSRDKTIMWWDAKTWKVRKVVPVLEEVETAGFLKSGKFSYTGGVNGNIRIWQSDNGREITQPQEPKGEGDAIVDSISLEGLPFILSIQSDHTMLLHSTNILDQIGPADTIPSLRQIRRISGTHDEIIDLGYLLPDRSLLALATNSEELRIISLTQTEDSPENPDYFGADIAQLIGHEDIIICLDIDWSGHWIATGAKDNTARLWRIDPANTSFTCYATLTGHAQSLGAIALPHIPPTESSAAHKSPLQNPPPFVLTGSQDRTIKRWDIPGMQTAARNAPRALYTRAAHDKDINAIDVNHNAQLFASASQDRTVKIWSVEEGEVQGVLRGHRRGVWSVKFAPKDTPGIVGENGPAAGKGLILTGSGDKTLKIWSLSDYSCLRTFEGHTHNVLKVAWLNLPKAEERGKKHVQVASAGGDGLVKVWDVNTGDVACTLDNHEDRVWALTVHPITNMIVSGSGDSTVTFWKDTTSSTQAASTAAAVQFVEQEQELQNYIHAKSYREAITLSLQLNHPARLLSLFTAVITSPPEEGSLTGVKAVDEVLSSLSDEQIFTLLLRIRDWNTNNRTAPVAQKILWMIVKSYPATRLANLKIRGAQGQKSLTEVLSALKVYSDRHYKRTEELLDQSYLLEYTLREMEGWVLLENKHVNGFEKDDDQDMIME
jgi:U3 small nucleolar RNA-associated protein 13